MLYTQMFVGMLVGLYISRVVLDVLGVEDYGIYNVVGGVVAMFGVLNTSMSATTSRYITIALGKNDSNGLKEVFGISITIHILLGICMVLLAELIGLWFLEYKMRIPEERMNAAVWVFHCSVATAFFYILNVPYNAMIIAMEKMAVFAYFSLIDLFLRLTVVLILPMSSMDKLKSYALLLVGVQLLMQILYWQYCFRNFSESRVGPKWHETKVKEMSSFAGWSLFGDSAALMFSQGVNVLLNLFFGATINAARGIAVQVQGVVIRFIGSFQTAINPQLTKSFAGHDYTYMYKLIYSSSKFSFFLFMMLALPIFFEANQLLAWWLKIVPDYTVTFLRIILFISLIDCLANPLITAAKATGKIKRYQSVLGVFLLLIVPVSYLFLKMGYPPYSVFVVHFIMVCIGHYIRMKLISPLINLDEREYLNNVIFKVVLVLCSASILPTMTYLLLDVSFMRLVIVTAASVISIFVSVWYIGASQYEKKMLTEKIRGNFLKG